MNVNETACAAIEKFWEEVARQHPEITTGDFPPDATQTFQTAAGNLIRLWLKVNKPEPVFFSGDWLLPDADPSSLIQEGHAPRVYQAVTWYHIGCGIQPIVTRTVAEQVVRDQQEMVAKQIDPNGFMRLVWNGDAIVSYIPEGDTLTDSYVTEVLPDENGNYDVGFGLCWFEWTDELAEFHGHPVIFPSQQEVS